MKSFLIIGMGHFGHHLCKAFAKLKCDIMIADQDAQLLEDMLPYVVSAKAGDCTNEDVLRSFGVEQFDACFVCIGGNFQNSLQITSLLKELGARKVYSKADEDVQAKFLLRNGADEIIYPELEAAANIAFSASNDNVFDSITLSNDYLICEIMPRKQWLGKSIVELNFRAEWKLSIMAVKKGSDVKFMPDAGYRFKEDEHIIVLGHKDDVNRATK